MRGEAQFAEPAARRDNPVAPTLRQDENLGSKPTETLRSCSRISSYLKLTKKSLERAGKIGLVKAFRFSLRRDARERGAGYGICQLLAEGLGVHRVPRVNDALTLGSAIAGTGSSWSPGRLAWTRTTLAAKRIDGL